MFVHLFGGASSPSCANYALKRTAEGNKEDFDAVTIATVKRNFYVDDCLKSVPTDPKDVKLVGELRELSSRRFSPDQMDIKFQEGNGLCT